MTEETIQAARRAWANDPEAAAQALLGCSAEELFITALRGCNQHRHKPGCPDADGGGESKQEKENVKKGKSKSFVVVSSGMEEPRRLEAASSADTNRPLVKVIYDKNTDQLKVRSTFKPIMNVDIDINEMRAIGLSTEEAISGEIGGILYGVEKANVKEDFTKSLLSGDELNFNFVYRAKK